MEIQISMRIFRIAGGTTVPPQQMSRYQLRHHLYADLGALINKSNSIRLNMQYKIPNKMWLAIWQGIIQQILIADFEGLFSKLVSNSQALYKKIGGDTGDKEHGALWWNSAFASFDSFADPQGSAETYEKMEKLWMFLVDEMSAAQSMFVHENKDNYPIMREACIVVLRFNFRRWMDALTKNIVLLFEENK